jgi:hypothetical protein
MYVNNCRQENRGEKKKERLGNDATFCATAVREIYIKL